MGAPQGWPGFTLIELLVVIGVLGILLTLILPVLKNTIRSAGSAQCVNSLRQLHSATMLCAGEHDGYLPLVYWMGRIGPYLGIDTSNPAIAERSKKFPICSVALKRSLALSSKTEDPSGNDNSWIRTHSMNRVLGEPSLVPENLKLMQIKAPSETVLFMDGHPEGAGYPYWWAEIRADLLSDIEGTFVHQG